MGHNRVKLPSDVDTIRTVKVKMGWVPIGVRIEATYEEQWKGAGTQKLQGSWEVTEQSGATGDCTIEAKKGNTLEIALKAGRTRAKPAGHVTTGGSGPQVRRWFQPVE